MAQREIDTGTAYGMKPREYKANLVEVGPGTPMGELMRRYWHPCFTSADLTSDKPERVRLLGEDLILFRDREGRPGLVHEHCCHRGSSLYYGRVEEDGIRCCYHGWKFDVKGHCVDQPAEVGRGLNRDRIRQPWYPVQELYGLVYAYMGPPEKKPVLPRYKHLENLDPDEYIVTRWEHGYGPRDEERRYKMNPLPFNWLQAYENSLDGVHVAWLHAHHSGDQFTGMGFVDDDSLPPYADTHDMVARLVADRSPLGVTSGMMMKAPDGTPIVGRNEAIFPNVLYIQEFIDLLYVIPADDTSFLNFMLWRCRKGQKRGDITELHDGKNWWQMTEEEHRRSPGDFEAQSSIGATPAHNREHLSPGDIGIGLLRRRLEEAVRDVQEGRDPPVVSFDEDAPPLEIQGHSFKPAVEAA